MNKLIHPLNLTKIYPNLKRILFLLVCSVSFSCSNILSTGISNLEPDTTPPMFSGLVSANVTGNTTADLIWFAANDNRTIPDKMVYNIYYWRTIDPEDMVTPKYTSAEGLKFFNVYGLESGKTYKFVVRAKDETGNMDTNTMQKIVVMNWVDSGSANWDEAYWNQAFW